jgi:hypothetical protein
MPTIRVPHSRLVGLTETLPVGVLLAPVPESATVCGLLVAESLKVSVAVRLPVAAGLNSTVTVQLAEAARLVPQLLLESVKSVASVPETAMLLMVTADEVPLVRVSVSELLEPTVTLPNARLVGLTVTLPEAEVPVPESATVCGLLVAESVKVRVAVRLPAAAGLNNTVTVQLAEAARLVPQLSLESVKSDASAPETAMLLMVTEAEVPLVRVSVSELLEPTVTLPNARLVGLTVTLPEAEVPVPESATFCGLLVAESVKVSVAVRLPVAAGLNSTVTVQLAEAARLVPQLLLESVKSAALVPETATLLRVIADEVPLVSVSVSELPLEPTATLPKASFVGLTVTVPVPVPRPESATVCGLLGSESVKVSEAVRVPAAAGWNFTATVQLAEAARLVPQLLLEMTNSVASVPVRAMLLRVTAAEPLLVSVTVFAPPVMPIATAFQLRLVGLTVTLGEAAVPVPERATVCGLLGSESVKVRVAVRLPAAAGLNRTVTVQLAEAARLVPQLLPDKVKSAALVPETATLLMVIAAEVPLVRVSVRELLEPTATLPKARLDGLTVTLPAAVPVPESATVCGLLVAESVKVRVAVRLPAAAGLNTTVTVQLAEAARLVPQVLLESVKSAASVPVTAMLLMVTAAEALLVRVTDFAPPALPTATEYQLRLDGLTVRVEAAVPVPERATVCGLFVAESVKVSVAVRLPAAAGWNSTVTVQLAEAARLVPQLLPDKVKSAALVPETATLLMVIAAEVPLVRVS